MLPHRLAVILSLTFTAAACGSDRPEWCAGDDPGVHVFVTGQPSSTTQVEVIVRDGTGGETCASQVWQTMPNGLAEARMTGEPGRTLRSSVDLARYSRLLIIGYAVEDGQRTHGACVELLPGPDQELACQEVFVEPKP